MISVLFTKDTVSKHNLAADSDYSLISIVRIQDLELVQGIMKFYKGFVGVAQW